MSIQSTPSSHSAFSALDGIAASATDVWLLIGRILLAWTFLAVGWGQFNNMAGSVGYFTSLGAPSPQLFYWLALLVELIISVTLILGIATRYGAVIAILFLIVAIAMAHRYWEYPAFGPGRISIDAMMRK
jgi:putative oxidoreductase